MRWFGRGSGSESGVIYIYACLLVLLCFDIVVLIWDKDQTSGSYSWSLLLGLMAWVVGVYARNVSIFNAPALIYLE